MLLYAFVTISFRHSHRKPPFVAEAPYAAQDEPTPKTTPWPIPHRTERSPTWNNWSDRMECMEHFALRRRMGAGWKAGYFHRCSRLVTS